MAKIKVKGIVIINQEKADTTILKNPRHQYRALPFKKENHLWITGITEIQLEKLDIEVLDVKKLRGIWYSLISGTLKDGILSID